MKKGPTPLGPKDRAAEGDEASPFEVLGLAPTLDLAEVKRAYFAKLKGCPPHRDPVGFAALRRAYEPLSTLPGLARAFVGAPSDLKALIRWRQAEAAAGVESGRARLAQKTGEMELRDSFIAALARLRLSGGPAEPRSRGEAHAP